MIKDILDDAARLAVGASGAAAGVKEELEQAARQRLERILENMNLVTREEFEVLQDRVDALQRDNEALTARLADMEKAKKKAAPRKPAATKARSK